MAERRPDWAPDDIDITRPSVARIYDYALGGSHNFAADREFAEQVFAALPDAPRMARDNRVFLRRAVQFLCSAGVDQFLDLGSGIPTVGAVHEIAHAATPAARITYVDNDPVAVAHGRRLLAGDERIAVLSADLRDPAAVLAAPEVREHLDLGRPVAVLLVSVLHFVDDDADPAGIVAAYTGAVADGSYLVLSHGTSEDTAEAGGAAALYRSARSPGAVRARSRAEIAALLDGLALTDPGLARLPLWRPEHPSDVPPDADRYFLYAAVGRIGQR